MKKTFVLIIVAFSALSMLTSCKTNDSISLTHSAEEEENTAYTDILNRIEAFEHEYSIPTGPVVETKAKFNWRFAIAVDSVPILLGLSFNDPHAMVGFVFVGVLCSAWFGWAAGEPFSNSSSTILPPPIDALTQSAYCGDLHNLVLHELMSEAESCCDTMIDDEWFFDHAKSIINKLIPDNSLSLSFSECQEILKRLPDARTCDSFENYKAACYQMLPEQNGLLDIVFKVHETVSEQTSAALADSYIEGVTQIVEESVLSEEEKQYLVGTVSVEAASRSFWYE